MQAHILEAAIEKAIAVLRTATNTGVAPEQTLARRLRDVERTLANLTETAAKGGAVPAVLEALNRADAERKALESHLSQLAKLSQAKDVCPDAGTLRRTLRGYLDQWHAMLEGNVTEARGLLSVVLRGRISFTPKIGANGDPIYELKIPIAFDQLLVRIVPGLAAGMSRVGLVDLTGVEPVTS